MMKKILTYAVSALALASCSSDSLVSDSPANTQAPIAFNVGQKNITRSTKLEAADYYDFGVWAYKTKSASFDVVMNNYQVGCSGYGSFKKEGATDGTWFYDGLNSQVLRYWDLSYDNTNFYAYAPYNTAVSFDKDTKTITVPASVNQAGTDHDVIYAGTKMTNSSHDKVPLEFKHLGAKVNLKFYHNIPGYKVELLEVTYGGNDIQATPATPGGTSYVDAHYFTKAEATIKYNDNMVPTASVDVTGEGNSDDNLVFKLPDGSKEVPAETTGTQNYLESPTTYYAVAQPKGSTTGFTFHVSFQLTAKDNNEVITVKDARVFVPASVTETGNTTYIAAWQPNTKYTYTFKITKDTKGTTSGAAPDVDDPKVPTTPALYPIVFDNITIVDYENEGSN